MAATTTSKIQIILNDGSTIPMEVLNYDASKLTSMINDPKNLMVNIGDVIINKNTIKLVLPITE